MTRLAEFYNTRNLFIEYTGYKKPLSYEEWSHKPDRLKAGLLFVQFYNEITLAWMKADSLDFGDDAEGVSTILQYLEKQVSQVQYYCKDDLTKKATAEYRKHNPDGFVAIEKRMIDENPEKFSSSYIYRVAYNCLYCICGHDRKRDKDIINNEVSPIVNYNGEELNLFDTIPDKHGSAESMAEAASFESEFWAVINQLGTRAAKVMRYLLSQNTSDLKALSKRSKIYNLDPLRDVEVSLDEVDQILDQIRARFLELPANSTCGSYISTFSNLQ